MTVGDSKLTVGVENKSHWETVNLGEIFKIKHGFAFKGEFFSENGNYVLLTPGNFQQEGGLKLKGDKEKYYIGEFPAEYLLNKGELLVVLTDLKQTAPILGASGFIRESNKFLHNQRLGKIVNLDESRVDINFLFYLFNYHQVRGQIKGSATGSTVRHTSPERIYEVNVSLPPLSTQRKIAGILSAYDRLIENNTRRIEILEEMARSIFREWFVKFRFPGHEQVQMVDSELGLIPEGWEVVALQDITSYINRGISPKYDDNSVSIVINQKCIRDGRLNLELARKHSKKVPFDKLVRFGDVLVNSTGVGTLGRVAQVYQNIEDCSIDSHVSIVRANDRVNIDYFGFTLVKLEPHFSDLGVGATGQTELRRQSLSETVVLIPPQHFQGKFSDIVAPMRQLCLKLSTKNGFLRKTRDLLLPRLISGEIDVENLDINTGPIAA